MALTEAFFSLGRARWPLTEAKKKQQESFVLTLNRRPGPCRAVSTKVASNLRGNGGVGMGGGILGGGGGGGGSTGGGGSRTGGGSGALAPSRAGESFGQRMYGRASLGLASGFGHNQVSAAWKGFAESMELVVPSPGGLGAPLLGAPPPLDPTDFGWDMQLGGGSGDAGRSRAKSLGAATSSVGYDIDWTEGGNDGGFQGGGAEGQGNRGVAGGEGEDGRERRRGREAS